jgi:hypothetical protein
VTLPTENKPTSPSVGKCVGENEGGDVRGCVAVLDPWVYRDMRWCATCEDFREYVELFEWAEGRLGVCLGCGEERVIPLTRVTTEVA